MLFRKAHLMLSDAGKLSSTASWFDTYRTSGLGRSRSPAMWSHRQRYILLRTAARHNIQINEYSKDIASTHERGVIGDRIYRTKNRLTSAECSLNRFFRKVAASVTAAPSCRIIPSRVGKSTLSRLSSWAPDKHDALDPHPHPHPLGQQYVLVAQAQPVTESHRQPAGRDVREVAAVRV